MSYTDEFYKQYNDYLKEPLVRMIHNKMFHIFTAGRIPLRILDLGCGLGEYYHYYGKGCADYYGVDKNNCGSHCSDVLDYTTDKLLLPFEPNGFISLFSAECCLDSKQKYTLYDKIFDDFPSIRTGLVSGFFYQRQREQLTVSEAGGIVSYQSIEDASRFISSKFLEFRLHVNVPSAMFGPDVVEVWKLLMKI